MTGSVLRTLQSRRACRANSSGKKRKTGRQEDNLGLSSGADQGPWSSAASAPSVSPAMADADATELQGNGEARRKTPRKKRGRRRQEDEESIQLGALASFYEKAQYVKWGDVADRDCLLPLCLGSCSIAGFAAMVLKGGAPARRGGSPGAPEVESRAERVSLPDRKCPSGPGLSGAVAPGACVL